VVILKEADAGLPAGYVIRKYGIGSASCYNWKFNYVGLDGSEQIRIKESEAQLTEFKQIVVDLTLENKAMKGLITKSSDASSNWNQTKLVSNPWPVKTFRSSGLS
jgi:putative transposase